MFRRVQARGSRHSFTQLQNLVDENTLAATCHRRITSGFQALWQKANNNITPPHISEASPAAGAPAIPG